MNAAHDETLNAAIDETLIAAPSRGRDRRNIERGARRNIERRNRRNIDRGPLKGLLHFSLAFHARESIEEGLQPTAIQREIAEGSKPSAID